MSADEDVPRGESGPRTEAGGNRSSKGSVPGSKSESRAEPGGSRRSDGTVPGSKSGPRTKRDARAGGSHPAEPAGGSRRFREDEGRRSKGYYDQKLAKALQRGRVWPCRRCGFQKNFKMKAYCFQCGTHWTEDEGSPVPSRSQVDGAMRDHRRALDALEHLQDKEQQLAQDYSRQKAKADKASARAADLEQSLEATRASLEKYRQEEATLDVAAAQMRLKRVQSGATD